MGRHSQLAPIRSRSRISKLQVGRRDSAVELLVRATARQPLHSRTGDDLGRNCTCSRSGSLRRRLPMRLISSSQERRVYGRERTNERAAVMEPHLQIAFRWTLIPARSHKNTVALPRASLCSALSGEACSPHAECERAELRMLVREALCNLP